MSSSRFGNDRDKELVVRVLQAAADRLGWWSLEQDIGASYSFAGGFTSGNTVAVVGATLRECLERVEEALR